jgi:ketosteroid isomerase-like protein
MAARWASVSHTFLAAARPDAAAAVLTAMCRTDWRLGGDDLVAAAQAAKAAVN